MEEVKRSDIVALSKEIIPQFAREQGITGKPLIAPRNRKAWDETDVACRQPEYRDYFLSDVDSNTVYGKQLLNSAKVLCASCPVRDECFELALLSGQEHIVQAGVPGSTIKAIATAIGSDTRKYIGGKIPQHPDRMSFYMATRLLHGVLSGIITVDQAKAAAFEGGHALERQSA